MDSVSSVSVTVTQDFYFQLSQFVREPYTYSLREIRFTRVIDQASVDRALIEYSDEELETACSVLEARLKLVRLSKAQKQRIELLRKHISQSLENRRILNLTLEVEERTKAYSEIAGERGESLGWKLTCAISLIAVIIVLGVGFMINKHYHQ